MKIARWNDINFYALKQAVEKTHRTLHKHIKQFQEVLGHPTRPLLTDTASDWLSSGHTEADASYHLPEVKAEMFVTDETV